jgi:hypothetical protein
MRFLGILLIFIGVFSSIWYFLDMNFLFFQWIDKWGTDIGWFVRGGFIVIGIIFISVGKPTEQE